MNVDLLGKHSIEQHLLILGHRVGINDGNVINSIQTSSLQQLRRYISEPCCSGMQNVIVLNQPVLLGEPVAVLLRRRREIRPLREQYQTKLVPQVGDVRQVLGERLHVIAPVPPDVDETGQLHHPT